MSATYKHLFGPVPSRRLGMSLGVDLIPHKICSLNCLYCECGRSTRVTMERKAYVPVEEIYRELTHFFDNHPDPEYITFSGAGEPTLHSGIGEVISYIKSRKPNLPVAVLTNGTLFSNPLVRGELMQADLVMPSLDAATETAFHKINRPAKNFTVDAYIRGLIDFRREFGGAIWMEVFILPGYNDDEANLKALRRALQKINPDRIQLNTLDRPGAVEGLKAASRVELEQIAGQWDLEHVEIIASPLDRHEGKSYREDVENVILETLSRRPCTLQDLVEITGLHINEINKYLGVLEGKDRIEMISQDRGDFYRLTTLQ